ncbi:hypothetical protein AB0C61_04420 [Streptomyces sp. NPDC048680]|uniref:hypothetical protein n=1 Tax=Streptomyces sp. NPDC048680 TaxID=3155492 RepID=UPI003420C9C2
MPNTSFDFAVGLNSKALNSAIEELHAKYRDLFRGSEGQAGSAESASWDVTEAPTVQVGPPSAGDWGRATDPDGNTPPSKPVPSDGAVLRITLTKTDAKVGESTRNLIDHKDVDVYASVSAVGGKIGVTILAIRLDTSGMNRWDKGALHVMLPHIMKAASHSMAGIAIPSIKMFDIDISLAAAMTLTTGSHLVVAAQQKGELVGGAADDFKWPTDQDLWILIGSHIIETFMRPEIDQLARWDHENTYYTEAQGRDIAVTYVPEHGDVKFDGALTIPLGVPYPMDAWNKDMGVIKVFMGPQMVNVTGEISGISSTEARYKITKVQEFWFEYRATFVMQALLVEYLNYHCQSVGFDAVKDKWVNKESAITFGTPLGYSFTVDGQTVGIRPKSDLDTCGYQGMQMISGEIEIH